MVLRTVAGRRAGESADDLRSWLSQLPDCPPITQTVLATCHNPRHIDEPATWFYVEADRAEGVARLRCLGCGDARSLLDSADRWTYPAVWCCPNCSQSIAEVAFGLHLEDDDTATWAALGVRCVNCGDLSGVTDFVLPGMTVEEFAAAF